MNNQKLQGIFFIILAGFFFSLMTLFVRISGELPTMQKAFFRNAVAAVVAIILLARSKEHFHIQRKSMTGLLLRSICGTCGLIMNFYAIGKLGLADANMLNKMSPFFAVLFSIPILKEKSRKLDYLFVLLAFVGSMFVIKPSANITSLYGLIGLMGGMFAGMAYVFVRKLGKEGERGPVIVMFFSGFSTLVTLPFFFLQYQPMTTRQLLYLLLAGVAAAGGQLSITKAYTLAPAKEISVYDYTQILFASLWGMLLLGELPDGLSFLGYLIIIGTAIVKWKVGNRPELQS